MTDLAPTPVKTVCGVDLVIPSEGWQPSMGHFNELEAGIKAASDEDFLDSRSKMRAMVIVDSDEYSAEDLQYFEKVLTLLAEEWMRRIWEGSPDDVADYYIENMTLEEIAVCRAELQAERDEDFATSTILPCEEGPINAYYDRLDELWEQRQEELSTSIRVNEAANTQADSDTTTESKGCGGSAPPPEEPAEQIAQAEETVVPKRKKKRRRRLEEDQEEYLERHPESAPPPDRMRMVSCEDNGCDGYCVKNKIWFCDELVTGIRKPKDHPEFWSSVEYADVWYGGGQLGYAAWANGVTVTVKCVEEGIIEGARATATTFGTATGWIGVGLGTIDLGICAARWGKTHNRVKDLDKLFRKHFTDNPTEVEIQKRINDYAWEKKYDKETRAILATYFAAVGVIGGVIGGIAFIASNPVGWAIALGFGIAAVLGGLGFLVWKGVNKAKKRVLARKERKRLMNCYRQRPRPHPVNASQIIRAVDGNKGTTSDEGLYEAEGNDPSNDKVVEKLLTQFTRKRRKTERQAMASAIIAFFLREIRELLVELEAELPLQDGGGQMEPAQQPERREPTQEELDAWINNSFGGSILAALNMKPIEMQRNYIKAKAKDQENGTQSKTQKLVAKWIESVMSKLKSW